MSAVSPGEARKCAVYTNELFRFNYLHNEPRGLTPFPRREMGVDGIYVRPVPTDRNDLGEP